MRKFILLGLMAAVAVPTAAPAQSRREIQRDRERVQEEREDLEDARDRGDRREIRRERRDLQEAREELREDRADRRRSRYVAPYRSWRYVAVTPGYQLRPGFYGSRYVITNPRAYGLQRAIGNRRWIRYGNDLVLVNIRNGRVLQVIRNRYY